MNVYLTGSSLGKRGMFDQKKYGTCVKFAIDGQQIMALTYEKMKEAKSSIWIANYDLDPDLRLIRRADRQKEYFKQSSYESDLVASSCQSESIAIDKKEGITNNFNYSYGDDYTLQNLLIEKARQKVDIKIILWEPRLIVRKLPISKRRGIEGREKKAKFIDQLAKDHGVDNYISVRLDSKAPTLTSGFHEKIIIIDNQIGFCGGQDLAQNKWDTSNHNFDSDLRDQGSKPWHDVNVMVQGPIVWDFIFHFNQRWVHSILKNDKWVNELVRRDSLGAYLSPRPFNSGSSYITNNQNEEKIEVIALRTWKRSDKSPSDIIFRSNSSCNIINHANGIRKWYDNMFRNGKYNIYLEDQFPFQDKIITQILIKRLKEQPDLKVITVGPMEPNLPGFIFGKISHESINDINSNLAALRRAGNGDRVKNYSLISQDPNTNSRRQQIYVHSKIMIVDDEWITIGSANTDRDGFEASTEFDLGITSSKLAQRLRVKLWTEHMGGYQYISPSVNLSNFDEGFDEWEEIAKENGKRVLNSEAIKGHIYYYNFEEMKFPSPYSGAKGGNKLGGFSILVPLRLTFY